MQRHTFMCIDAHTCGNPVRLVAGGGPQLRGHTMSEKRQDFLNRFDWVRRALMFEPRGHSMMSGSIVYPAINPGADAAVLFIETSGCLPMCGHGTIGTVTIALEHGLITPREEGKLALDVPAGQISVTYQREGDRIISVRIQNVASYLAWQDVAIDCPGLGRLAVDIAYGGNFYAIIEAQENFQDMDDFSVSDLLRLSPLVRKSVNEVVNCIHPEDTTIAGVSHVLWAGKPKTATGNARNAVFYGDSAIDRSPCGTGTSARMAQLHARGRLQVSDTFVHESIIGSQFIGRIEGETKVGDFPAILPSIEGWARVTGINTIFVDEADPYAHGFSVV